MSEQRFVLTDDHIRLLSRAYVGWQDCEFGAPEIDPKRPYGNSSVVLDIAEILGVEYPEDGDLPREVEDRLCTLHRETQMALQAILDTKSFETGEYVRDGYKPWHRDGDAPADLGRCNENNHRNSRCD